jgi:molybdate-binding protein/DNA-binding transcriptional regulator YhcF (GntR family)
MRITMQLPFHTAPLPLYAQIAEQLKSDIAAGRLSPGQRLPTVRQMAGELNINPGTVARAYGELERDGIVQAKRGGGTFVAVRPDDEGLELALEGRLAGAFNRTILEGLGLGYGPEELESLFLLYLARWQEERARRESGEGVARVSSSEGAIVFMGSHDLAMDTLTSHIRRKRPRIGFDATYVGSLEGLIAVEQNKAHLCGMHLLDEETGEYNIPYVRRLLPGQKVALVNLAYRVQGLMVANNNPKGIKGLKDLGRGDTTLVNRQRGSGTRVLLDRRLKELDINPNTIIGYDHEVGTHLAVASAIAGGAADIGLGIEAAAQALSIGFVPLEEERYDLVIPQSYYESELLSPLLGVLQSGPFRRALGALRGYRADHTGETSFID